MRIPLAVPALALLAAAGAARADVVISDQPTRHMSCNAGLCAPLAKNAVLNAGDLASMLASGDVSVSSGNGALSIVLDSALSWTSASTLTLTAWNYVVLDKPLVVAGPGNLTIVGSLRFPGGHAEIWDMSSALTVNNERYALASSFHDLQRLARSSAFVALAKSIAAPRRTLPSSPIPSFGSSKASAILEGLGNTISGLTIDDETTRDPVGLIGTVKNGAAVRDIVLSGVNVKGSGVEKITGSLVGENFGSVLGSSASGSVTASGTASYAGGLVGRNDLGGVGLCHADVAVTVSGTSFVAGGLVGFSSGQVGSCYATGAVVGDQDTTMGGLVGTSSGGTITNAYARGAVSGGDAVVAGGLVGGNGTDGTSFAGIARSYATGAVSGGPHAFLGGLIGTDSTEARNEQAYWDLDLSGIDDPSGGSGNIADDPGLKGLSSAQFQSGLPKGFRKIDWAQSPDINGGFPYLIGVTVP